MPLHIFIYTRIFFRNNIYNGLRIIFSIINSGEAPGGQEGGLVRLPGIEPAPTQANSAHWPIRLASVKYA